MFRFIRYKITNKKLLNTSLLVGVVLLAAFLCIYPMFREGSLNKIIQTLFMEQQEKTEVFPAVMSKTDSVLNEDFVSVDNVMKLMDDYRDTWLHYVDCPVIEEQRILYSKPANANTQFNEKAKVVAMGYIPDMYDHVLLQYGCKAEDAKGQGNELVQKALSAGAYPCVISQEMMDKYELVVGESLYFKFNLYGDDQETSFVITGIVEENPEDAYFWNNRLSAYNNTLWVSKDIFENLYIEKGISECKYDEFVLLDYTAINNENAALYRHYVKEFKSQDKLFNCNFESVLASYCEQETTVSIILLAFEMPIVALLLLFLYMISGRILEMETTEIAMLKSRGISRGKVIKLYLLQSSIISFIGCVLGLPIGILMCRLAAGTNAFLSFSLKDVSIYKPVVGMLLFALLAFALAVLFMTLPVISLSKLTITERRTIRLSTKAKPFWEKYFVDLALLGVSAYLLYNYNKQKNLMAAEIIAGGEIDPVVFLDSSLFILSCGLLFLRLIGYLVRLIYRLGKKHWSPAGYVSFLQIIRSAKKQGFISVFIVMTIAMGVFNANLARTVNENMEERTRYNVGTDLVAQEKWKLVTVKVGDEILWEYQEPDYERFSACDSLGVESKTRVIRDDNTDITIKGKSEMGHTLMAISSKEFGETARFSDNVNDTHWFNYLNELAGNPKAVLISSNLAKKYDVKIGDEISYSRYSPIDKKETYAKTTGVVAGILDAFPGYESTSYRMNSTGEMQEEEHYLIVANYSVVINAFQKTPYEMWMRLSSDADVDKITETMTGMGIDLKSMVNCEEEVQRQRDSSMIQITNGMFSIGFIVSLLICAVGFLIFWVLTIKEREMLYGIYRAMGMSMKEIIKMLVTEQIFSSLLAALSGFGVGVITTVLFTKLISVVYLPKKHNIPMEIFVKPEDSIKIVVIIAIAFTACFMIMRRTVKNMNITKALKMGED